MKMKVHQKHEKDRNSVFYLLITLILLSSCLCTADRAGCFQVPNKSPDSEMQKYALGDLGFCEAEARGHQDKWLSKYIG